MDVFQLLIHVSPVALLHQSHYSLDEFSPYPWNHNCCGNHSIEEAVESEVILVQRSIQDSFLEIELLYQDFKVDEMAFLSLF